MKYLFLLLLVCGSVTPTVRAQSTYYVASDGDDTGSGTLDVPFATLGTALARAAAGDTIYVRGGTYTSSAPIRITRSGAEGALLHVWAYPGEAPVFDFTGASKGFDIRGSYLHLKGLTAEKSNDNGIFVKRASHNILEQLVARYNGDSGVQVEDGSAYNLLLNVDSYGNYDAANLGENADGFAIKFGVGPGNVLRGCRAWGNSDDGYDFWSRDHPGQQGVTVEESWAFRNGYDNWGAANFQGDSNGFKLGHGPGPHVLVRNVAWSHRAHGFDVNGNLSGVTLYNNTGFLNGGNNFNFDDDRNVAQGVSVLRNNASVGRVRVDDSVVEGSHNSWSVGIPSLGASDFESVDDDGADGPRGPDGSLPDLAFLRPAPGSPLIDAGVDVGLPYLGNAPDLGAFEYAASSTVVEAEPVQAGARLIANYPNPFRTSTRLNYEVAETGPVRLAVYNTLGQRVAILVDGVVPAGRHTVDWEAGLERLPAGVYVAHLEAGRTRASLQMVRLH